MLVLGAASTARSSLFDIPFSFVVHFDRWQKHGGGSGEERGRAPAWRGAPAEQSAGVSRTSVASGLAARRGGGRA